MQSKLIKLISALVVQNFDRLIHKNICDFIKLAADKKRIIFIYQQLSLYGNNNSLFKRLIVYLKLLVIFTVDLNIQLYIYFEYSRFNRIANVFLNFFYCSWHDMLCIYLFTLSEIYYNNIMSTKLILVLLPLTIFLCSAMRTRTTTPSLNLTSLINLELAKHNYYRSLHGVPALTLNRTLVNIAQSYSEHIYNIHEFQHSTPAINGQYGQNLYWSWGSPSLKYTGGSASTSWYNEKVNYNYTSGTSKNGKVVGHFTAMIWKSVKTVGFGFTQGEEDGGYAIYVVANYYPTPNVEGQYTENVLR